MTIDEKLKELEEITNKLEDNNLSLEESLKLYEKGINLSKELYKDVEASKGKVTVIKQELDKFKEENTEI